MAFQLAAIPLLGKALTALKGGAAVAKAGGIKRLAGDALGNTGRFLLNNAGSNKTEVIGRLAPDIGFGILSGAMTPGDLGDKLIAGGTQALGGAVGGIGAAGLAKKVGAGGTTQFLADIGGSYGGDFVGMAVGDGIMRGKDKLMGGEGLTPYERANKDYQEQMRIQMEQEILAKYGIDPFLADNGLG